MANLTSISPFRPDPDKIMEAFGLNESDFSPADESEKESMVEKHKSVSYWRDAWRRFRANTVSMVALGIFALCLLFAFVGPSLIPYGYGDQYRNSQKLGPFEYSKGEERIRSVQDVGDGFYATALQRGSITALRKGDYYITHKGNTYAFTLKKSLEKAMIFLDTSAEEPLYVVKESNIKDMSKNSPVACE